jgi:hypothetical protein
MVECGCFRRTWIDIRPNPEGTYTKDFNDDNGYGGWRANEAP